MSNYVKSTDFASKDALPTGNPTKIVKGTEIDDEFASIETNMSTKADLISPTFTGVPTVPVAGQATNTSQIASTSFVKTAVAALNLTLGTDWAIEVVGTDLLIKYLGTSLAKLDSTGNLTVIGTVTPSGTI